MPQPPVPPAAPQAPPVAVPPAIPPRVRHDGERYLLMATHERQDAIERLAVRAQLQGYHVHWRVYGEDTPSPVYALYKRRK